VGREGRAAAEETQTIATFGISERNSGGVQMIYKPKGRRYYMFKFMWQGELIRKSTRATSARDARSIEGRVRSELARGNWDVLEAKPTPTLAKFLSNEFLPFTESKCAEKPATVRYYAVGAKSLLSSDLASKAIDEITDQHAGQFAARRSHLSPSTVNCGLRTLRRALYLAAEWGKLRHKPKITLVKGERQRDRVLTEIEIELYLGVCEQPWRDAATIMLGTGMRPSEVFSLRWENILLNGSGGLLQITDGKSKAARRMLPLVPTVYSALKARQSKREGWVFPADTESGHLEGGSAKNYHARALAAIKKGAAEQKIHNPLKSFPPYTMRHTALTRLADAGCDAFTLARIAGHSSITITQRYCHPQADAIERAFAKLTGG
jgi:integrase